MRRRFPRPFNCHSYTTPLSYLGPNPSFSQGNWYSPRGRREFFSTKPIFPSTEISSRGNDGAFSRNATHDHASIIDHVCRATSKVSRFIARRRERWWRDPIEDLRDLSSLFLFLRSDRWRTIGRERRGN